MNHEKNLLGARAIESYKRFLSSLALKLCLTGTGLPIGLYHLFYAFILQDNTPPSEKFCNNSINTNTIEMMVRVAFGGMTLLITMGYAFSLVAQHNQYQLHMRRPLHLAEAAYYVVNGAALFSLLFCSLSGFSYNGNLLDIKQGETLALLECIPLAGLSLITFYSCLDLTDELKKENTLFRYPTFNF